MIQRIRHQDKCVPVQIAAIKVLGEASETYDVASINALGGCLWDKNPDVKRSAGEVLHKLMPTTTAMNQEGNAWAAFPKAGEVTCWGNQERGGDSSMVQQQLLSGVKSISAAKSAFAELKEWVPS
jgi:hypothetical protein